MTRKIPYKSTVTNSNANYRQTLSQDTKWVLDQCKTLVQVAEACIKEGIKEGDRLTHTNPNIPRQGTGKVNSCHTMCQGVLDNFNTHQRDMTDKTMAGITEAFRVGEEVINDFEDVVFEEVDKLPKIYAPQDTIPTGTTLGDLFEIETVTVTYRRK
jgi:hypothetical protein